MHRLQLDFDEVVCFCHLLSLTCIHAHTHTHIQSPMNYVHHHQSNQYFYYRNEIISHLDTNYHLLSHICQNLEQYMKKIRVLSESKSKGLDNGETVICLLRPYLLGWEILSGRFICVFDPRPHPIEHVMRILSKEIVPTLYHLTLEQSMPLVVYMYM